MNFKKFEDMEVWQEARKLSQFVHRFCHNAREKKDWSWADQVSKAALSIMANIAEGNDAMTNVEFIKFLGYAKRSAAEVRSHLYFGFDAGYMNELECNEALAYAKRIGGQLGALMYYLSRQKNVRRIFKPLSKGNM